MTDTPIYIACPFTNFVSECSKVRINDQLVTLTTEVREALYKMNIQAYSMTRTASNKWIMQPRVDGIPGYALPSWHFTFVV